MPLNTPQSPRTIPRHAGLIVYKDGDYRSRFCGSADTTPQVSRIALSGTSASEVSVTAVLGEDSVTVTTTFAGSVDATNATALAAALNADATFMSFFTTAAVASSTNVDLTGIRTLAPTVTVSGTGLSVSTTQAASEDTALDYGRAYVIGSRGTDGNVTATQIGTLSALAGPVLTFTATFDNAADTYSIAGLLLDPDGAIVRVSETGSVGANLAAFLAAVDADLDGDITGADVDSSGSPDIVWSLPVGYQVISMEASATNSSDLSYALTSAGSATPDAGTIGIQINPMNDEFADFSGTYVTSRRASRGVTLATQGVLISVPVASGVSPSDGDDVWVETATGATKHLVYPTPSTTRFKLSGAKFVAGASSDNISIVER